MTQNTKATIHVDGGSRGNPGPAAFAFVIRVDGQPDVDGAATIGTATNNVAEYTALIRALEKAAELGLSELAILSDSELMVKQMNGEYRVKNLELQDLYAEAQDLRRRFDRVTLAHVRREQNKRADELCNLALDGKPLDTKRAPTAPKTASAPKVHASDARVRGDVLACLGAAANSWSANGPDQPPVALVWEQIWSILEDGNVLKKTKAN